ncbi:MAG: sigma-70 family RNA polymerase sigma factor [Cytophagaceae bacterium]|jgi:RNA polymerase sigma-70 factor (ECF subfamily)|nr:sigma-70 family RNA polymerase sigma factor [Cytophagaceae bacterium]
MEQQAISELVQLSRHGDTKAFEKLAVEFQPLVFSLAFRLLCNEDDAKDVVQETFIRAWTKLNRYKSQYSFCTWIYKIAGNLCYDQLRKQKRSRCSNLSATDLNISSLEDIETSVINRELAHWIEYFTEALTPKQRLVFTLRDIEGLSVDEVQAVTGLTSAKIKSNLYLARTEIKNKLRTISS